MRYRHHGSRKLGEVPLQPRDRFCIEMVGGLVEQQHVRLLEQSATKRHPTLLSTRKFADLSVRWWETKRVHGYLYLAIDVPGVYGVDLLLNPCLVVEQLRHLVVRHRLGEFVRDLLELFQQVMHWLDREIDVLPDVL